MPYRCDFCSVRTFFGDTFRLRPLEDGVSEVKGIRHRLVMLTMITSSGIRDIRGNSFRPSQYMEVINSLHRNGIAIWASFIFGFDHDDPLVFERTVEFAIKAKALSAVFALLTPYPGTEFYNRMKAEGRLTDERWWLRDDQQEHAPHFEPMRMSRQ